jgi:hypothetical protein
VSVVLGSGHFDSQTSKFNPRLPLYAGKANKDRNIFAMAVDLLNDDLQQLCDFNGVHVRHTKHTLPNLRRLMLHFQELMKVGGAEGGNIQHQSITHLLPQKLSVSLPPTPSASGIATPEHSAAYSSASSALDLRDISASAGGSQPQSAPLGAYLIREPVPTALYS